jgi:regulator of cell morphogenesis and NO signaling
MSTTLSITNWTVGELAVENPNSIRVFEAWKIDYCCGGRTPLADACAAAGKTVDEFIAELEAAATFTTGIPDWSSRTLSAIASGIVGVYHRYTREELKTLETLSEKVRGVHGERRAELIEVAQLVKALIADMMPHMLKEEQVLFPYVERLEEAAESHREPPTPFFGTVKNPVRMMMLEHDRVGELLAQLRRVTSDYVLPEGACFSYRELYRRFAEFEARTHEHIHIENNLYFPRAVELEERAGQPLPVGGGCGMSPGHAC